MQPLRGPLGAVAEGFWGLLFIVVSWAVKRPTPNKGTPRFARSVVFFGFVVGVVDLGAAFYTALSSKEFALVVGAAGSGLGGVYVFLDFLKKDVSTTRSWSYAGYVLMKVVFLASYAGTIRSALAILSVGRAVASIALIAALGLFAMRHTDTTPREEPFLLREDSTVTVPAPKRWWWTHREAPNDPPPPVDTPKQTMQGLLATHRSLYRGALSMDDGDDRDSLLHVDDDQSDVQSEVQSRVNHQNDSDDEEKGYASSVRSVRTTRSVVVRADDEPATLGEFYAMTTSQDDVLHVQVHVEKFETLANGVALFHLRATLDAKTATAAHRRDHLTLLCENYLGAPPFSETDAEFPAALAAALDARRLVAVFKSRPAANDRLKKFLTTLDLLPSDQKKKRRNFSGDSAITTASYYASVPTLQSSLASPPAEPSTEFQYPKVACPTLVGYDEPFQAVVSGLSVGSAASRTDVLRESMTGTLASGRIMYRIDVMKNHHLAWRCVKTYAQLRELVKHAKRYQQRTKRFALGLNGLSLTRPRNPHHHKSPMHDDDLIWRLDNGEAKAQADKALDAVIESRSPAGLLFLEADVIEYASGGGGEKKSAWDLTVVDDEVHWVPCTRDDDKKRRDASRLQLDRDLQAPALNAVPFEEEEDERDVAEIAYRAAQLAVGMLRAVNAPVDARADVQDQVDLDKYFDRVDNEADARLLRGGDGAQTYEDLLEERKEGPLPTNDEPQKRRFGRGSRRISASLPPMAVNNKETNEPKSFWDAVDDGSTGGVWVTLARYRNALLHTTAWRKFRSLVGSLKTAKALLERAESGAARAARAATLANLHAALSFHAVLAWGAGSGRPGSTQRCRNAARYVLCDTTGGGGSDPLMVKTENPVSSPQRRLSQQGQQDVMQQGVSLAGLETALLRKLPANLGERGALRRARLQGRTGARAVDLRGALILSSGRASGAPLAAIPPRPPATARAVLRFAARSVVDASVDLGRAGQRRKVTEDDDDETPSHSMVDDPAVATHRDSLFLGGDDDLPYLDDEAPPILNPTDRKRGAFFGGRKKDIVWTVSMPYDFQRHASVVARRQWTTEDVSRGKRRRARRAHLLRLKQGQNKPGSEEWSTAADAQRRKEKRQAARIKKRRQKMLGASSESDDTSEDDDEKPFEDDLASSSDSGPDVALPADPAARRQAAMKNLADFLMATGGPAIHSKLQSALDSGDRLETRFRDPDWRPALRLLPQPPPDFDPLRLPEDD